MLLVVFSFRIAAYFSAVEFSDVLGQSYRKVNVFLLQHFVIWHQCKPIYSTVLVKH